MASNDKLWLHSMLFLGIVALPAGLSAVTAEVAFERTKHLEFCASCHAMDGHVADLKDPKSENLAAKHYQYRRINRDQCYTCHVGYALFDPVKGKIRGLRHLAANYLGPSDPELKLYEPFPNKNCLQCHAGAKSYMAAEIHSDSADAIASGEQSCVDCHNPMHPRGAPAKEVVSR